MASEFNGEVTSRMLEVAREKAGTLQLEIRHTSRVPGAFDMPVIVDALLRREDIDGVVTLGAIIKGRTKHDELIARTTARSLSDLSVRHQKPVSLGISGPGMHERQAHARIRPVAERAVEAVLSVYDELKRISRPCS
ncbi:riboflavin synthase beta chain [Cenarchaeum symbiosum A]|uniref:6,7-dimethyl-8-ribityllumazine synthase n=1 Tax=Cenarchaeum symbiosum (strain A) TaxID=414004 RepID=A0RYF0_CENSY|nr:riboflavin synthase beta chain [Cenarchaeum symbiosum A]